MNGHYGEDYDRSVAVAGEDPDRWSGRRDTILRMRPGGAILDLGCSSGGFLAAMKRPAWKLFGIEMSEQVAKVARERSGADVFVGDIKDAPYGAGEFDVVTCFHVLEHLDRPAEVLRCVHDWLKPGGMFYMMVPNIESGGARIFRSYWYALELPRHLTHFSPGSLRHMARSVGFEELSLTTHRELFFENSVRYIFDALLGKAGIRRTPLACRNSPSLPWRAARKLFRLTILPGLTWLASLAGDGESIHAIFQKPSVGSQPDRPEWAAKSSRCL